MRIGIDARLAIKERRGIGNYTLKLIKGLAETDPNNQYYLYTDSEDFCGVLPKSERFVIRKLWPSNYLLWEQISLNRAAVRDRLDILHCTANTAPVITRRNYKLITTICDVMYLKKSLPRSPSIYQNAGRLYRSIVVPRVIKFSDKLISISQKTKDDMLEIIDGIDEQKISVIHLSTSNDEGSGKSERDIKKNYSIKGDYILALGAIDPRKNTKMILDCYGELRREGKIKECLVLPGIERLHSSVPEGVILTGFVSDADLQDLYKYSKIFLYPSLYEGFGIPVLDAMKNGTPVITSKVSSLPEIAGGAAVLIDPYSKSDLKKAILKVLLDNSFSSFLVKKGFENILRFDWGKTVKSTLDIYNGLCGK